MDKWEYACVTTEQQGGAARVLVAHGNVDMPTTNQNLSPQSLVSFLNRLGHDSWDLIAIDTVTGPAPLYWLKRLVRTKVQVLA